MRSLLELQGITPSEMDLYMAHEVLRNLFLEFHGNLISICDYKFTLEKAISQSIAKLMEENSEGCLTLISFCFTFLHLNVLHSYIYCKVK